MTLNISKAMDKFELADEVELNCGDFDIVIGQAAVHNEKFRAAVTKRTLGQRRKSLVPQSGTLTGALEEDVELFIDHVLLGWGKRPLVDDDGVEVPFTRVNLTEMFLENDKKGRTLFGKIFQAAATEEMFTLTEEELENS